MKTKYLLPFALASLAPFGAVPASAAHWDLPSCYIDMHDGCFNIEPNCSDDDYQSLLENCDTAYPSAQAVPRPKGLAATPPTRQVLQSASYKTKIQKMQSSFSK